MPKPPPDSSPSIPLSPVPPPGAAASSSPSASTLRLPAGRLFRRSRETSPSGSSSDLEHLSKEVSRQGSPFAEISPPSNSYSDRDRSRRRSSGSGEEEEEEEEGSGVGVWDTEATYVEGEEDHHHTDTMPSDLRPSMEEVKSSHHQPLLSSDKHRHSYDDSRPRLSRHSSHFRERDAEAEAHKATRKRYTIAGMFLMVSLVSFIVQTETAVYIQHNLKWNKAYCMLYVIHPLDIKSQSKY